MNVIRVNLPTFNDYIVERDKMLDNFIAICTIDPSFEEFICIHTFSYIKAKLNTDSSIPGTRATLIEGTFPNDKKSNTTKLSYQNTDKPIPTTMDEQPMTLIDTPDTINIYVFHSKGTVWILRDAIFNVLTTTGFTKLSIVGNDILIGDYKCFGTTCMVSGSKCGEWGYLTYHWEQSYHDLLTPTEQATKLITGIEDEANKLSIPFNRVDFENDLITEIERLLPITDPIIPQH